MATFTTAQLKAIAGWLYDLDSHGIYEADLLEPLAEMGVEVARLPTHSHERTEAAIRGRGLGGHLGADTGERLFWGYQVARELAVMTLGEAPGDRYMGRGSAFRANAEAILHKATAGEL